MKPEMLSSLASQLIVKLYSIATEYICNIFPELVFVDKYFLTTGPQCDHKRSAENRFYL